MNGLNSNTIDLVNKTKKMVEMAESLRIHGHRQEAMKYALRAASLLLLARTLQQMTDATQTKVQNNR
jgi:hypothetical protein